MAGVWSYEGKRVLVSGGGGAGMGAAAVRDLLELGAEVHVFDIKEPASKVASYRSVDLRDPAAIEAAVADLGGPLDALFNCAGLPGPPFSGLDVMLVNFLAARLSDHSGRRAHGAGARPCAPSPRRAPSGGRTSWSRWDRSSPPPATPRGGRGARSTPRRWARGTCCPSRPSSSGPCTPRSTSPPRGSASTRTSPGPTQTPMMPSFENYMGKDFMDRFPKPLGGRNSTPEEQGHLVVFLNSDAASYITGTNVYADGGFSAGMLTSRLDFSVLSGETPAG